MPEVEISELTREQARARYMRALGEANSAYNKIPNDYLHLDQKEFAAQRLMAARRALAKFDQLYSIDG